MTFRCNPDESCGQAELFATAPTPRCTAKGCPGRPSLCLHDAEIAHGHIDAHSRRPTTCLNRKGQLAADQPLPF